MRNIELALAEEHRYIEEKLAGKQSSLIDRLKPFGYSTLTEYFNDKKDLQFRNWNPEFHPVDIKDASSELETAIMQNKTGVWYTYSNDLYAFHGSDEIDYDLCAKMGIVIADMNYSGGTIIGGPKDLGIEFLVPRELDLYLNQFMQKFYQIIKKYFPNDLVEIVGNDILLNGKKILGSMTRSFSKIYVWAAQLSFENHNDTISLICNKKSTKQPGYMDNKVLNRDLVLSEVKSWLLNL